MVALDGFRMAVTRENCRNIADKKFIIAAKIMNELAKIIADGINIAVQPEMEMEEINKFLN